MNRLVAPNGRRRLPLLRRTGLKWPGLSRTEWLFLLCGIAGAIALVGLLVSDGFRRASELNRAQQLETHTLDVIGAAERVRGAVWNMQRGQRGYLLTGDGRYLEPYIQGHAQVQPGLDDLRRLTSDNEWQRAALDRLQNEVARLQNELGETIVLERGGRASAASAIVHSGVGEHLIRHAGGEIDGIIARETHLLAERRNALRDADAAEWRNRLAVSAFALIALAGLGFLLPLILGARRRIEFQRVRADLAEQLVSSEAQLAEQIEELNALYASAPIGLAFFSRDYRYLRVNHELAQIHGVAVEDHFERPMRDIVPANAVMVEPVIDHVFATGESVRNVEVTGETPLQPGVTRHWLTGFYPVKNEQGHVEAVGAWVIEISERKRAEEREALLAREVDHRAKNLLAVVQSVVQLTQADEPDELKAGIVGRIQALARAHSLLADSRWDGARLDDLVREELAPYLAGSDGRASVEGPQLLLRPAAAQSLAMVLHELATNAVKYGGLSTTAGRVDVRWERAADSLEIQWSERGGPPVKPPKRSGFGSKIMRASVDRQLHGSLVQDWRPEGLQCTIRISAREALRAAEQQSAA